MWYKLEIIRTKIDHVIKLHDNKFFQHPLCLCIYIYIYIYVCVCVCGYAAVVNLGMFDTFCQYNKTKQTILVNSSTNFSLKPRHLSGNSKGS